MIEGLDYCFIYPKDDKETAHIKIIEGPYKNTTFKYGKVKFKEIDEQVHLQFAYYVLESDVMKPKKMESDPDFKQFAGDLLVEIMGSEIEQEIIDEVGTDDFNKFNLQ